VTRILRAKNAPLKSLISHPTTLQTFTKDCAIALGVPTEKQVSVVHPPPFVLDFDRVIELLERAIDRREPKQSIGRP
jgi:hypothetical protein